MTDLTSLSEIKILTLTLIGESRGDAIESQVGVGCVIRNRVLSKKKSYKEICLQPFQFSCWNKDDPNRVLLDNLIIVLNAGGKFETPSHVQCAFVAKGIINFNIMDNTRGSLNYLSSLLYNSSHKPSWASNVYFSIVHGNHTFFKIDESKTVKV